MKNKLEVMVVGMNKLVKTISKRFKYENIKLYRPVNYLKTKKSWEDFYIDKNGNTKRTFK